MSKAMKWFETYRMIASIRCQSAHEAEEMIKAAKRGGFRLFEISMQNPQALRLIEKYSRSEDDFFGASGVMGGEMANRAIAAGARFLSTYFVDSDIINIAKNSDVFTITSVMTPTEAVAAYRAGADLVQIYPISNVGGPEYIRSLRRSMPFLKLAAAGGVTVENAYEYLRHCVAVSIHKALFEQNSQRKVDWVKMRDRAQLLVDRVESLKAPK